jgi:hypothetical protein
MKTLHTSRGHTGDREFAAAEIKLSADEASANAADERIKALECASRAQWGEDMVNWICEDPRHLDGLIDEKTRLIQVTIPAGEILSPTQGPAHIRTLDGDSVEVELISKGPCTEFEKNGTNYFFLVPTEANAIIPGMMVPVDLPVGPEIRGVTIPVSAVVLNEGRAWAYFQMDADHLVRREIFTKIPADDGWFMADSFSPGDLIVVSGAQLLLSDEFLSQYQIIEIAE